MNIFTFLKNVIFMCRDKKKTFALPDVNNIIYLYCIKSIQIKGTIHPLEKFNWLATSSGPQINEAFQVLNEYRKGNLYIDDEERLDNRSRRILDYVIDKYYADPGFMQICKGEAYYSAMVDYHKFNQHPKTGKKVYVEKFPLMEWLDIYREARASLQSHPDVNALTREYEKYGIVHPRTVTANVPVPVQPPKAFAKLSIKSDEPLALTISFENKEQFKAFIDKL